MRRIGRKLLTGGLVALYGGISLLGYGLHELVPGAHHGPCDDVASHDHCHGDHAEHHDGRHVPASNAPVLCDSHDCEICAYLAQINSERPSAAARFAWQHFVAIAENAAPHITSQTILGLHVPRGPPTIVG
jgi:hypothetical protein